MDSRRQRRKSFPLENSHLSSSILQRYPSNSFYRCCCSNNDDDSFNDRSCLNGNNRNQTRAWKRWAIGDSSNLERNIVRYESHEEDEKDLKKQCRRNVDHRLASNDEAPAIRHGQFVNNRRVAVNPASVYCIPRCRREAKDDSKSGNNLGAVDDVACIAAASCTGPAGNGRLRRRRRDATASTARAARRLRRERRARCLARTTIASRRGVVVGCRKKVRRSVVTVLRSSAVVRRGCRALQLVAGGRRKVVQRCRKKSGTPRSTTTSRIITREKFVTIGKLTCQRTFDDIVDKNNYEITDNIEQHRRQKIDEDFQRYDDSTDFRSSQNWTKKNRSNESSSSSSPGIGSPNVRLRRKTRCDSGEYSNFAVACEFQDKKYIDDDPLLGELASRIKKLLYDNDSEWLDNAILVADMKSKAPADAQRDAVNDANDPNEDTEKYDEFNAVMVPVARILSKSPQSDEGIETDTERRKVRMTRCWSLDSANPGDEEASRSSSQSEKRKTKQRVTRCCSSDSAVLSDEDQVKGWENLILCDGAECESTEGRPRYWRTPSVVVSDYSDYSYLEEKYERSDPDLEKYEGGISGTPSQSSSCSCLDCDEICEYQDLSRTIDNHLLQVCGRRRHSDSCCACLASNGAIANGGVNDATNRRNSCLASPTPYRNGNRTESGSVDYSNVEQRTRDGSRATIELLDIPPARKISDCSTNSSLSGDDFEVTELQPFQRPQPDSQGLPPMPPVTGQTPPQRCSPCVRDFSGFDEHSRTYFN